MAREIDPENLSEDDKQYLLERPWMEEEFRRQGYEKQMDAYRKEAGDAPEQPKTPRDITTQDAALGTPKEPQPAPQVPGTEVPEEESDDYDTWTKAELEVEIDSRNEDLDDNTKMSRTGTKQELIDRLRENDTAV